MADADDNKNKEEPKEQEGETTPESADKKPSSVGLLPWIIMAVVVLVCAGIGLGLGQLLAGQDATETAEPPQQQDPLEDLKAGASKAGAGDLWYYDMDPVVANLDEPGATRYIRATLTLGVSPEMDQEKGTAFFDGKKPVLIDCLTIYLSSLTIQDVTGARNLRRIQSRILDAFNEELFPDTKPQIKKVLIREFPIQ